MEGFEVGAGAGVGVAALVGGFVCLGDVAQEGVGIFAELHGVYRTTEAAEGGDVVQEVAADGVCLCGGGKAGAVLCDEPGDAFPVLEEVLGVFVRHGGGAVRSGYIEHAGAGCCGWLRDGSRCGGATREGGGGVREDVQGGAAVDGALGDGAFAAEGGEQLLFAGDGSAVFYAGGERAQGCKAALYGGDVGAGDGICHGGGE